MNIFVSEGTSVFIKQKQILLDNDFLSFLYNNKEFLVKITPFFAVRLYFN